MIAWSIETALTSGLFERVIVSTDDDEIAQVAREEGAEVPFRRPQELSDAHTDTAAVVAHAARALILAEDVPVCCIYATAFLVDPERLAYGLEMLGTGATYAVSVTRFDYPIQRALRRGRGGRVSMMDPSMLSVRSQDLEPAYHDAGQFYWARAKTWIAGLPVFDSEAYGVVLPSHRVVDVDTP